MGGNAEDIAFRPIQEALGQSVCDGRLFCIYTENEMTTLQSRIVVVNTF